MFTIGMFAHEMHIKESKATNFKLECKWNLIRFCFENLLLCILIPKEPWILKEHNLDFDRLCRLEKWSNGAKILVCGGGPSYLSNKKIFTQNIFMVSELKGF